MLEDRRESRVCGNDIERAKWCSILFKNAAMMDRAGRMDDALSLLAQNMVNVAGIDSCVILLRCVDDRFKIATRRGTCPAGIEQIRLSKKALARVDKKEPVVLAAKDLGLSRIGKYVGTGFLCISLASHEKFSGLAVLFSAGKPVEFSADIIELLAMMGIHGAHAIDEYLYKEELQKRSDELRRVYEIQRRITQSIDLDKATESIIENAPYITNLQYCLIFLLDPYERKIISVKAPESLEKKFGKLKFDLDELVASKIAINERKPLFIEDSVNYPNISKRVVEMMDSKSVIILPLMARDRVLGVMWLFSSDRMLHFDENDRRSAIALSDQAAVVIDNARIFQELEKSYKKLKDMDKTKMEFFTLISHELRNPLAVIRGFTELLNDGILGPVNERQKEKLERIIENIDKLADMVGKMSDISSLESRRYQIDMTYVSLGDMIIQVTDSMGFLFKNKNIELVNKVPADLPLVPMDRNKIEQVLLNLLNNALKYTPEGGKVTVSGKDEVTDILVCIHDTGIGIPEKDLDKIFTGFYHSGYKLSYEYKGPGLGLAISHRIIESHGGQIWAKSEVGKGSTFYFTIPKHAESQVEGSSVSQ
jgi:signal transduction histidine kinase